ncbi:MAG: radical SAM protein [Chloroflexi bacterium]|nr:radical SAM protein [Chloroflexota bacterium]
MKDAHAPLTVSWNITAACNLRCPHCYIDGGRRRPNELSAAEGRALIDQMAETGTELLILTGGEPLLRRDLAELVSHAAGRGMKVVLGTNGMLLTRERAAVLRDCGLVAAGISIDSTDPARHDAFRGVQGAWRRAVDGMAACRAAGVAVLVHTTALRMNVAEIPSIVAFAHRQDAQAFQLFFLVCTGRGERLADITPPEYERLLHFILDAQRTYPGMVLRARCAPYLRRLAMELAMERGLSAAGMIGCLAGTSYCRVTSTGDVTPCPYLPTKAGNVREQGFRELWEASPALAQLRGPALGGKCGRCPYSRGGDPVCVGCRARAFALGGDALGADPWCLYEPEPHAQERASAATPAPAEQPMAWAAEAQERLGRIPTFVRSRVKQAAEAHARAQGLAAVTLDTLDELRRRAPGAHARA